MFGLEAVGDLIDLLQEPGALFVAVLFREPARLRESVIAVEPVDDLQCPVDRLEVAALEPLEELEDHLLEAGDLQPGEVFSRRDPAVAQFLAQDGLGSLRVSRSVETISSTPAPAIREARTRWARVTRFDLLGGFVWVMGVSWRRQLARRGGQVAKIAAWWRTNGRIRMMRARAGEFRQLAVRRASTVLSIGQ
jgi:hypothetical protein